MKTAVGSYVGPSALVSLALMICVPAARAEYDVQVVMLPGASFTQTFGVNNAGLVVGTADDGMAGVSFTYDIRTGEYATIDNGLSALEISNNGTIVGSVDEFCAIRGTNGDITFFYPPSSGEICQARGVNANGNVSGFEVDESGIWRGFIFDAQRGTYKEFLPSPMTIAAAINASGQNVGSVFLDADMAYPGSPAGRYGYLREADGTVRFVEVSQAFPGQTRLRGISESGVVAGWYLDPDKFELKSFVTRLSADPGFESLTLTDEEILHRSPCDPELPDPPGPGYDLFTDMSAEQIRNDGLVVGLCTDTYFNPTTGDFVSYSQGFVATPVR